MLPSNSFINDKQDAFDLLTPLPSKPRKKRGADRQREKPIEEHDAWIALVLQEGRITLKASPNMKEYKDFILEPEARNKFGHIVTDVIAPIRRQKPRKSSGNSLVRQQEGQPLPYARKTPKRRHQTILDELPPQSYFLNHAPFDEQDAPRADRKMALGLTDGQAQKKWFADAFRAVQQVGCRTIAKVWIKKLHPKKQSTHPYNGGLPRELSPDANRTKPPYWPDEVRHKEPDHIDRAARTKLLVHLINNTPQKQIKASADPPVYIFAQDLLSALEEKRDDFKDDRWAIIQEIIAVREQVEAFTHGGEHYDSSATIPVTDFRDLARSKNGADADEDEDIKAKQDDDDDFAGTPPSGNSTSAPSPEDPLRQIAQYSSCLRQDARASVTDIDQVDSISCPENSTTELQEDTIRMVDAHKRFIAQQIPTTDFLAVSAAQAHPSLSVNADVYDLKSNLGIEQRVGRPSTRQKLSRMPRPSHHPTHEMAMMPGWGVNNSPTDFLPIEYTFNGTQCHIPIPTETFRMSEAVTSGMTDSSMDVMNASMMDPMSCRTFMSGHGRPMPTRTMSSSHLQTVDQSMSGPPHSTYFHD